MTAPDIMAALQAHKVRHFRIEADFTRWGEERCHFEWFGTADPGDDEPWGFGRCVTPGEALERMLEQVIESKQPPKPMEAAS